MKTFSVVADIKRNRLHITLKGIPNKKELDRLYTELRFCVADLKPSFDVVNDMSACNMGALSGLGTLRKIMHYLISNKVGRVVRVVDENKLIFTQLMNMIRKIQGYTTIDVNSVEEAETILSKEELRGGIRFRLYDQPIDYFVGDQKGAGYISDLSMSGCRVQKVSFQPAVDETVAISIPFDKHEGLLGVFEGKAKIIWVSEKSFGARFEGVESGTQGQLWDRLLYESTLDKKA